MNIKHVKAGTLWTKLALFSYAFSLGIGLYGNSRTKFSSDFSYNVSQNILKGTRNIILVSLSTCYQVSAFGNRLRSLPLGTQEVSFFWLLRSTLCHPTTKVFRISGMSLWAREMFAIMPSSGK